MTKSACNLARFCETLAVLLNSPLLRRLVLHVRAVAPGREGVRLPLLALPGRAIVADVGQQVVLGREKLGDSPDERVPYFLLQVAGRVVPFRTAKKKKNTIRWRGETPGRDGW